MNRSDKKSVKKETNNSSSKTQSDNNSSKDRLIVSIFGFKIDYTGKSVYLFIIAFILVIGFFSIVAYSLIVDIEPVESSEKMWDVSSKCSPEIFGKTGGVNCTLKDIEFAEKKFSFNNNCSGNYTGARWLYPEGNWGDEPGINLTKYNFKKITFYVKGETGKEKVNFGAGGNYERDYKDSFKVLRKEDPLPNYWVKREISLENENLSHVISGFYYSIDRSDDLPFTNFSLMDIQYE